MSDTIEITTGDTTLELVTGGDTVEIITGQGAPGSNGVFAGTEATKSTPVSADKFAILDSEDSDAPKYVLYSSISSGGGSSHDAVTVVDSSEIDFTLTGQQITASLVTASIDESKLDASVNASLGLADSATQPGDLATVATSGAYSDLSGTPTIPTVDDTAYAASWNGNTDAPTKNAVYDKIETLGSGGGVDTSGTPVANDFARFTDADTIEGRSTSEVKSDLAIVHSDVGDYDTELAGKTNTTAFTPTADYHPATKKYVDDEIVGAGGYNDESAQDAIGTILVDSSEIDFTYNDATPSITASIVAASIDESKLDTSVNASLDLADSALQDITGEAFGSLSDVTITSIASGELLQWNGSTFINQTFAELGLQEVLSEGAFVNGDKTKLDGIETGADVTDTANVTTAGALMDSELADIAAVKALDQGVATTDGPQFATVELGNASDTTLSRSAAGEAAVEGKRLLNTGDLGKQTIWIEAGSMKPEDTGGAEFSRHEGSGGDNLMLDRLLFDSSAVERAQWKSYMPKSWDAGTVSIIIEWRSSGASDQVSWEVDAVCLGDNDVFGETFGTVVLMNDTASSTAGATSVSSAGTLTIKNAAAEEYAYFRITRQPGYLHDTSTNDAELLSITILYNTDALNDD